MLLIFPELVNFDIIKKFNLNKINIQVNKDFILALSLMIIDGSDNVNYVFYKYNLSNEAKNRINFINKIFPKILKKDLFDELNLKKLFYYNTRQNVIDLINFQIINNEKLNKKLIKMKKIFEKIDKPKLPIKADDLIRNYGLIEGVAIGKKMKEIEQIWIDNNFVINEDQIKKIAIT